MYTQEQRDGKCWCLGKKKTRKKIAHEQDWFKVLITRGTCYNPAECAIKENKDGR